MVTITLHCLHCQSDAWTCSQWQTTVSLSSVRTAKPREPHSPRLSASSPRRDSARLPRTQQSAWPHPHIRGFSHHRVHVDQNKGAQLPPFRTTLLAPDPEEPTSTTLELDERMARLCSKKPRRSGCGLPCAARRDKWSPMRLGIGVNRRASGGGRPFHQLIAKGMASPTRSRPTRR